MAKKAKRQWLSNGNTKYADSVKRVLTWGIPALRSKTGLVTCPGAGICARLCYAQQGRMAMSNCQNAQEARLKLAQSPDFVPTLTAELAKRKWDVVRIHDTGDFFDKSYLEKWLKVMGQFPTKSFFAYTKNIPLFQDPGLKLPPNFRVVYSLGGKWDDRVDLDKEPHSRIFETAEEASKAGYVESPNEFPLSFSVSHTREALVYHGNKSYNTAMNGRKAKSKGGK